MNTLIRYFAKKHLLVNLITLVVFIGGVYSWVHTNKEELPDITFNTVRISTSYSGAAAEDIEFYITKPLEEALIGMEGVKRITSSSSPGNSNLQVELDQDIDDIDKMKTDIQNQVNSVSLPDDVLNDPSVRVFETSKKAIIDIALYNTKKDLLTVKDRQKLQEVARALENRLVSQKEIFELRASGYLKEEVIIQANPERFNFFEIPLSTIAQEIRRNHVRAPSGTLKSGQNEQVTLLSELDTKDKLDNLVVQGGFDSNPVRLKAIAKITDGFEDTTSIYKVNGKEAILFQVVKNSQYGILDSLEIIHKVVASFEKTVLKESDIALTYLDDESIDIRNRLSIITSNGVLGFLLILISLFIFLNKRSAFWVAMGIPFTLCFTAIAVNLMGYTINGITLAGVIIVLGIVVDDAIIVAENISRKINEGMSLEDASIEGTKEVVAPVFASILTTCVAFIPLYFFTGRYGLFVIFIPPMIFLMLLASLLESFLLLPSHMTLFPGKSSPSPARKWFQKWEGSYEKFLNKLLPKRYYILAFFLVLLIGSGIVIKKEFSFVMFPEEESREVVLSGIATNATSPSETSKEIQNFENFLTTYIGKEGIGVRTRIAQGRRGDSDVENRFEITLEILPADKREKSSKEIVKEIEDFAKTQKNLEKVRIRRNRFGQSSGSVFEILVQENDDKRRDALVAKLVKVLEDHPDITNIEPDVIPLKKEYSLNYNQAELKRLSVSPASVSETLRMILNGTRLYTLFRNDEEIDVTLTVNDELRKDLYTALSVPVENTQKYLVPLKDVVQVNEIQAKKTIRRIDEKRTSFVYADISPKSSRSPLDIAEELETHVFPEILTEFPSSKLNFDGEIIDTRESKQDLISGVIFSILLIYLILAILFDSVFKPLRIMLVIPFGMIGVALAFYAHQKTQFGFYAAIGTLGMLGVVVNDAIVMLDKLDSAEQSQSETVETFTSSIAKTRLRAIILTTLTTVAGVMPTAYGFGGTDSMLSDMMIAMAWGLLFGTAITLILIPCFYLFEQDIKTAISKFKLKTLLPLLIIGSVLTTQTQITASTTLSLNEFLEKASQNDSTFHTLLAQQHQLRYNQQRYVDSPELTFGIDSDLDINSGDSSSTLTLSQTLPKWGQTLSASGSADNSSGTTDTSATFTFSQDIAQNAFGKHFQLSSDLQLIKTDISHYQLLEAYEDYLATLTSLYYTWIRQYESLQLAKSSYKENKKVFDSIKNRKQKKIANETDVNKLTLQILAKEENIINYKQNMLETTQKIKRSIQANPTIELIPDTRISLDELTDQEASIEHFKSTSRTSLLLAKLRDQSLTNTKIAARDLLPSIAFTSSIYKDTDTTTTVGASMSLPLFKTQSKAVFEATKLKELEVASDIRTTQTTLETQLRVLHNQLNTQRSLIEIATKKKQLAYSILKEESENYSFGKIDLNDYIAAVNQYDVARFNEIDRKITYQQLSTEWKRLTDQLVIKL